MWTKAKIYNSALSALLLQRQVANPDTDNSNEAKVLNQHYDVALAQTLVDLDLDGCSSTVQLELVKAFDLNATPAPLWKYAYKYPSNCAFFRRIQSCERTDGRYTHIAKRVAVYNKLKVIYTDEVNAIAEIIPTDVQLTALNPGAGLAVSLRLAIMGAPLITGKGAKTLIEQITKNYVIAKAEAQQQDERENFSFQDDSTISEFVAARLS